MSEIFMDGDGGFTFSYSSSYSFSLFFSLDSFESSPKSKTIPNLARSAKERPLVYYEDYSPSSTESL